MERTKKDLKKKATTFDSLDKKELQNVCGGGWFVWDSVNKKMYFIP
ncbi:MAG: hypothetical protein LBC48_00155 [Dysgonamonadaceae bacterium]|jgi:hypothetical protein|nr:hypothetical protein [Dysgonamonadaceae bacterium]